MRRAAGSVAAVSSPRKAVQSIGQRAWLPQLIGLLLCLPLQAHAQFQKFPWPASQATPVLDASDLQGLRWTNERLKGHTVVLNFWATWCAPCKEELPSLQTLHELSAGEPLVVGVNVREPATPVKRYLKATGIDFPVLLDAQGELARRWGVTVYPTTFVIGPDGRVRWRIQGEVDWTGAEPVRWFTALR